MRIPAFRSFRLLLTAGVPGLLVLTRATVWLVVGRSLRPVKQIRGAVTDTSHARQALFFQWATPGILEAVKPGRMQGHGGTEKVPR